MKQKETIEKCLKERAIQTPDGVALDGEMGRFTWKQMNEISTALAYRLYNNGVKKGSHVGIWSVNTPNWFFTFFALEKLGAVPILLNTHYKEVELSQLIAYAQIEYICYGDSYEKQDVTQVLNRLYAMDTGLETCMSIAMESGEGCFTMDGFEEEEKSPEAFACIEKISDTICSEDMAAMLFTSGTCSVPKGVPLTHGNLLKNAQDTSERMGWCEDDSILLAVSLFHCFGTSTCLLTSLFSRCTNVVLPYYKTERVLMNIEKYQCTILNGVPSMFLALIHNKAFSNYKIDTLRTGIIAGSSISKQEYALIAEKIPSLNLVPSYGQTETSPCVTLAFLSDSLERKCHYSGKVIPGVEVKIDGKESGEILVKGYNVMGGYYNLDKPSKEAFTEDGWLRTGDMGVLTEDGYLSIVGRKKEIIIRAGENIAPSEIEGVIVEIPEIESVKVLGVAAAVIQERIVACIIVKDGAEISEELIKEYVRERLARYKVPEEVLVYDEFPITASGKIKLEELKNTVLERLKLKER